MPPSNAPRERLPKWAWARAEQQLWMSNERYARQPNPDDNVVPWRLQQVVWGPEGRAAHKEQGFREAYHKWSRAAVEQKIPRAIGRGDRADDGKAQRTRQGRQNRAPWYGEEEWSVLDWDEREAAREFDTVIAHIAGGPTWRAWLPEGTARAHQRRAANDNTFADEPTAGAPLSLYPTYARTAAERQQVERFEQEAEMAFMNEQADRYTGEAEETRATQHSVDPVATAASTSSCTERPPQDNVATAAEHVHLAVRGRATQNASTEPSPPASCPNCTALLVHHTVSTTVYPDITMTTPDDQSTPEEDPGGRALQRVADAMYDKAHPDDENALFTKSHWEGLGAVDWAEGRSHDEVLMERLDVATHNAISTKLGTTCPDNQSGEVTFTATEMRYLKRQRKAPDRPLEFWKRRGDGTGVDARTLNGSWVRTHPIDDVFQPNEHCTDEMLVHQKDGTIAGAWTDDLQPWTRQIDTAIEFVNVSRHIARNVTLEALKDDHAKRNRVYALHNAIAKGLRAGQYYRTPEEEVFLRATLTGPTLDVTSPPAIVTTNHEVERLVADRVSRCMVPRPTNENPTGELLHLELYVGALHEDCLERGAQPWVYHSIIQRLGELRSGSDYTVLTDTAARVGVTTMEVLYHAPNSFQYEHASWRMIEWLKVVDDSHYAKPIVTSVLHALTQARRELRLDISVALMAGQEEGDTKQQKGVKASEKKLVALTRQRWDRNIDDSERANMATALLVASAELHEAHLTKYLDDDTQELQRRLAWERIWEREERKETDEARYATMEPDQRELAYVRREEWRQRRKAEADAAIDTDTDTVMADNTAHAIVRPAPAQGEAVPAPTTDAEDELDYYDGYEDEAATEAQARDRAQLKRQGFE